MSSPSIILTSEFVVAHDRGSVDYLDRQDRQVDKDKNQTINIESEAHDILSLDMIRQFDEFDFSNYLNYLSRQQALEKINEPTTIEKNERQSIEKKLSDMKQKSLAISDDPEHIEVRGLFDSQHDSLTIERKEFYQDFFEEASKNGAFLFQDVVSFDTNFLIENGVYDPITNRLDNVKLKQAGRIMMKKYFELEGLNETGQWVGAIHYNTDHFHIHFSTTEAQNTRPLFSITDKNTGEKKLVHNGYKKQATINQMKSTFANQLISRSKELEKINQLRNKLVIQVRETSLNSKRTQKLTKIRNSLPNEKNKWQYNRLSSDVKKEINETIKLLLNNNDEFKQFKSLIKEEGLYRNSLYRTDENNDYYQGKLKEMDVRFGNALLKNMKAVEKEEVFKKTEKLSVRPNKKTTDEKIFSNNLNHFSKSNQQRLKKQFPDVSMIGNRRYWYEQGKIIKPDESPLIISVPIMKSDGKTLSHFSEGKVYDISQTKSVDRDIRTEVEKIRENNRPDQIENKSSKPRRLQNNLYKFSKHDRESILNQKDNATTVFTKYQWFKKGYTPRRSEKPIFIESSYVDDNKKQTVQFERAVFDKSQVREASKHELKQMKRKFDSFYKTSYQESAIDYSNRSVNKISRLLEKDYEAERNKFEKEKLDRQVQIAQQENNFGY